MKCLHCGYCCKQLAVVIVDDPAKGIYEGNMAYHAGNNTPCKHLAGDKPGEYMCKIHDEPWYNETPCYQHVQVERSLDTPCRMGAYLLSMKKPYEQLLTTRST